MAHVFTPLQNRTHSMDVSLIGLEEGDTSDSSDSSDSDIDSEPEAPPYSPLPSDFDYTSSTDEEVEMEETDKDAEVTIAEKTVVVVESNQQANFEYIEDKGEIVTYTMVGDNLDSTIKRRYMRVGQGNLSLHYFHFFAALDRLNLSKLSFSAPPKPTKTAKECALSLLPSIATIMHSEVISSPWFHVL